MRGYTLPATHDDTIDDYCVVIPIPKNALYRQALFGALNSLGRWFVWEKTGDNRGAVAASFFRHLFSDSLKFKTCVNSAENDTIDEQKLSFLRECFNKEEDGQHMVQYQKFGGVWFIGFPCGDCGGVEWVSLGTGAQLDTNSVPLPAQDNSTTVPDIGAGKENCYASKSVDYLLSRFSQYLKIVAGGTELVLDKFFNDADEVIDFANIALGASDTDSVISQIVDYGADAVYNDVYAHRPALVANFNLTGKITRVDLLEFFYASVGRWNIGAFAITDWLTNSFLLGLSRDIEKIANDCNAFAGSNTDEALPDTTPYAEWIGAIVEPNQALQRYDYFTNETFATNEQNIVIPAPPASSDIVAIAIYIEIENLHVNDFVRGNAAASGGIFRTNVTHWQGQDVLMGTWAAIDPNTLEPTIVSSDYQLSAIPVGDITLTSEIWEEFLGQYKLVKVSVWTET